MNPRMKKLTERRDAIKAQLETYDNQVIERSQDLEGVEAENYNALTTELEGVVGQIEEISKREQLINRSLEAGAAAGVKVEGGIKIPAKPKGDDSELIYRQGGEFSPFRDLVLQAQGDPDAAARIYKHNQANGDDIRIDRATTVSALGGLVVPQFLTGEVVDYAREGRPFADVVGKHPLTAYTTSIPVVTSPLDMAMVDGEGTAYTSANFGTTKLDVTAKTIAGYTEVSVEAVAFGALPESALFNELQKVYNQKLDYQLFHGTDANGQLEGIFASDGLNSVTGSSATSGAAELYPLVVEAASKVYEGIFQEATYVVMSPQRWYRILSELGTDKRPLFGVRDSMPQNVQGSAASRTFANLPVVIDANIYTATSADTRVVVCRASELWLLEQNGGRPVSLTVDQAKASQGLVQFIARGFVGWTAERRPKATTVISGLPVPSFS